MIEANDVETALILGATGGIGAEMAAALSRHGWQIRVLHRNPAKAGARNTPPGMTWVEGDALNPADVVKAAPGASLIVHAVNPPGYRNWAQWVLPMLESSISAARASGARILLPGTLYNYGPDAFPILHEDSPQNPLTRKAKIRAEMERRLRAAAVGNPNIAVHTFPWPLITLLSPFVTLFREMREMRYLWR